MGLEDKDAAIMGFCLGSAALVFIVCVAKSMKKDPEGHEQIPLTTTRAPDVFTAQVPQAPLEEVMVDESDDEEDDAVGAGAVLVDDGPEAQFGAFGIERAEKMDGKVVQGNRANDGLDRAEAYDKLVKFCFKVRFRKSVKLWKKQEEARRGRLAEGVTGSIKMGVDKKMAVTNLQPEGPAEAAGIKMGDILLVVQRLGRGGATFNHPLRDRQHFLGAIGPQAEVFNGTDIKILAATTDEQKKKWMNSASEADSKLDGWMSRVEAVKPTVYEVRLGEETENARKTRRKHMNTVAKQKNLPIDVDFVDSFLSDAGKCKDFVKSVFDKADEDGSGYLDINEIHGVFTELTRVTGLPEPDKKDSARMFSVMDESHDEKVTFDEFYPYFRTKMIMMITNEFVKSGQDEE
eukprot:TRINITY_DN4737_c0_g2_i1.p1 TRINITY_DN4737_c0_g2~~TRINITY_DN4737_c0_g2_i1.p1  ORF type:complete len:404 (+),score=118.94 TRINITY_DN4737_c0_g2_i1:47-1258(+)